MRTDTGKVFHLEDYKPTDFLIPETHLDFTLDPERTIVKSKLIVERRAGVGADAPLILDGDELKLVDIRIDGAPLGDNAYMASPERLEIRGLPESGRFTLEITTEINPTLNRQLTGLYRSSGVYCTQCEAEGFRRITYFLDRPDLLSVYTVRIEAARSEAPLLLSNGNPKDKGALTDGRHFAVWHDPHPKPAYLFALVAGDLGVINDSFTTASGRHVDLGIYVEHGKEARALYAMDALKRSMKWDEEAFGREYDLDIFNVVAVSDFNMGAMENKGLNVFNDKYVLADPETATDADYAGIEAVIAHEYFHNWTGNRITCRDWFQLCLKEGLTVYRDHEFSADMRSRPVKRIAEVKALKAHQFPEDAGPLAHPVRPRQFREINNFYTSTVYEKGSEVVRMIRTILGPELFRKGMDLYFERHDGDAATIEDFIKVFEDASGEDLSQFGLWYDQAGTPNLAVTYDYDQATKTFEIEIEQSLKPTPGQASKKPMHIPIKFGLLGAKGRELKPRSAKGGLVDGDVIHLRKRKERFTLSGIAERPVPSLLRGFSAPVTMTSELTRTDLIFLARNDGDEVNRWQALTELLNSKLTSNAKRIRGGKPATIESSSIKLLGEIAANVVLDEAFRALCLSVPSESDIARELGANIDPDAILASRDALIKTVAEANEEKFTQIYEQLADDGPFQPDAASAGRRALRNVLLDYLCVAEADPKRAAAQFNGADNMSDRAAALHVLVQRFSGSDATSHALKAFEDRFGSDALVMDKWFIVQAMQPGVGALQRVQGLMKHKLFSLDNPNRARALIGAFSSGNQTGFNRADGNGYVFFAETILTIEKKNPQLAARLLTAMRSWRSFEPVRREHAREALANIAKVGGLSADVRDIVERTLA
ncbi:aminopeptidase N [Phyllobacterium sp. BT25]|uniref:Aminopeptidase N n=1 Tax=Phyllobacterium pellucidum TaxID=2740464 RepID=A0A849VLI5_9HYPH|nr:aminopeptidase N [Phyllobacterium pellucidum]NTS30166.1 aminopeptidase N [Phyllobacterium pellucidum]